MARIHFLLSCRNQRIQQAQTVRGRLERSGKVWEALTVFADAEGADERVVSALHDVAMAGRVPLATTVIIGFA